ncbi:hypothetical protein PTI98_011621 [Pleurotus ostreatus]|nr:hypothetical protein PTI98_011621 [Pleurotus ostreatus]
MERNNGEDISLGALVGEESWDVPSPPRFRTNRIPPAVLALVGSGLRQGCPNCNALWTLPKASPNPRPSRPRDEFRVKVSYKILEDRGGLSHWEFGPTQGYGSSWELIADSEVLGLRFRHFVWVMGFWRDLGTQIRHIHAPTPLRLYSLRNWNRGALYIE